VRQWACAEDEYPRWRWSVHMPGSRQGRISDIDFVIISDDVRNCERCFLDKPIRYGEESDKRKMGHRHCGQGILTLTGRKLSSGWRQKAGRVTPRTPVLKEWLKTEW